MGRVKFGALVTEIRGSIGGTTFQSNAYGYTIKNKPCMIKPSSVSALNIQRIMREVTTAWRGLTDIQRSSFVTYASTFPQYAKYNPSSLLGGYDIFVMWNCTRLTGSQPLIKAAANVGVTFPIVAPSLSRSGGSLLFNLNESIGEPDAAWLVSLSPVVPASRNFVGSTFRFMTAVATGDPDINFTAFYQSIFGTLPVASDTVFARLVPYGIIDPSVNAEQLFKIVVS
jgi:hypothetical protein